LIRQQIAILASHRTSKAASCTSPD
jgi:hypothetical protein